MKLPLLLIPLIAALGCTDRHHPNYYIENRGGYPIRVSMDDGKPSDSIAPHQTLQIHDCYTSSGTLTVLAADGKQVLANMPTLYAPEDMALDRSSNWEYRVTYIYPPPNSDPNYHPSK